MARHAPLLFTVLAVLAVAAASASAYVRAADKGGGELTIIRAHQLVGDEEDDEFALGGGVVIRRRMQQQDLNSSSLDANETSNSTATTTPTTYISYAALSRDRVPCDQQGASYYNCRPGAQANPYERGCSKITQCRG